MTEHGHECDAAFLEEVEGRWELKRCIDASKIPRLLVIAKRCQSVQRVEDENTWLRKRMDEMTTTNFAEQPENDPEQAIH